MKILEVCTVSSSAYALVFQRAMALNKRHPALKIDILCTDGPEVNLMREQGINVVVSTLYRSLNPVLLLRSIWNLYRAIQFGGYEVIHLHFGIPGLVGRILALFKPTIVWIYQSHGYSITEHNSFFTKNLYIGIEKLLKNTVRFSLFQLQEDIALAQQYKLLRDEQIIYIGNGIDLSRFQPTATELITKPTIFGMVARFEPIKNHTLLINAVTLLAKHTRDFRVKLIGQGHLKTAIQTLIQQNHLNDLIEILDYSNDMPAFYQSIDVGLLTSLAEGIPRALIEPMAAGKPVICTDVKGSREAIIDQKTGFKVPLGDAAALAKTMQWFIEHPLERQQMGQAAYQHATQQFSEENVLNILAQVYLQCLPQTNKNGHPVGETA